MVTAALHPKVKKASGLLGWRAEAHRIETMRERVCDAVTKSAYQLGRELKGSISMPPLPACLGHPPLTMRHSNVEHHIFIRIWWNKRDEAEAKAARANLAVCAACTRTTNTWRKWASIRAEVNAGTMRMWRKVKVERVSAHSEKEMHLFSVCVCAR